MLRFLVRFFCCLDGSRVDYGWVVSSWYRFNFLGTVFCSSLVSATLSYADDIAHIKI